MPENTRRSPLPRAALLACLLAGGLLAFAGAAEAGRPLPDFGCLATGCTGCKVLQPGEIPPGPNYRIVECRWTQPEP